MNYAYVSVLTTESYLIGILSVAECLKRVNSKFPFYVVITDNISKETEMLLNKYEIKTIRRKSLEIPQTIKQKNSQSFFAHWTNTFDKLSIFELTQFDKIIYLDSDMYIRKNIDSLFNKKNMSTPPNRKYGPNITPPPELTSAILVIEPKNGLLNSFLEIMQTISNKNGAIGDQDILQEFYKDWKNQNDLHLDVKYNTFFTYLDYYITYKGYSLNDIYVFHFILSKKPWEFSLQTINEYIQYLNNRVEFLYKQYGSQDLLDCINSGNYNKNIIAKEYLELIEEIKKKL